MILSSRIKYGMQALVYMTRVMNDKAISSKQIASDLNIPKEFVSKILQSLVIDGCLGSKKGKNGGFFFVVPPSKIKLHSVFSALGYSAFTKECFLGLNGLCSENLCELCNHWDELGLEYESVLKQISIQTVSETKFNSMKK